jgi:hypothetical protein
MAPEGPSRVRPAWEWAGLPPKEYEARLRSLAKWVTWLADNYGQWVELPACWPLHELLRQELAFFCYWHRQILRFGRDPSEGVRWHVSLRSAAQRWRALSSCRHDGASVGFTNVDGARRVALQRFLVQVPDLGDGAAV